MSYDYDSDVLDASWQNSTDDSDFPSCEQFGDISSFNFTAYNFPRPDQLLKTFHFKDYIKIVICAIVIAVVLIGNCAVIIAVALNRTLRTTINIYLSNLAVADVLIAICCMWVHLINNLTEPFYILGPFMCKINGFAQSKSFDNIH